MRGRNTENIERGKGIKVAECKGKRHVVLKFIHEEKHIIFNPIGEGRRKKEISNGVKVIISLVT